MSEPKFICDKCGKPAYKQTCLECAVPRLVQWAKEGMPQKVFDQDRPLIRFMVDQPMTPEEFLQALRRDLLEAAGAQDKWAATEFGMLTEAITTLLGDQEEQDRLLALAKKEWPEGNW